MACLCSWGDDLARLAVRHAPGQSEGKTGVLYREPARLRRPRCDARESVGLDGRRFAHRDAWLWQDHFASHFLDRQNCCF